MRFISAPWLGLLDNDVWLRNARHANAMAQLLQTRLQEIPGVSIMFPSESNAVFAQLPAQAAKAMRARGWKFYEFIGAGGCRLMCAWDTRPETVERFAAEVRELCAA
jgi:threonine aldolase